MATVESTKLEQAYWSGTFELALKAIDMSITDAITELSDRVDEVYKLTESDVITDFACLRPRVLTVAGYLAAYALHRKIAGAEDWRMPVLDDLIQRHSQLFLRFSPEHPYGEAAVPQLLAVAWYLEWTGEISLASSAVGSLITMILRLQNRGGFPNPYYGAEECIRHRLGIDVIDESFTWHSYSIRALVEWMARRFWRQFIRGSWQSLSRIQNCEFVPAEKWGFYLWRCDQGDERTRFPDQTQSWAELRRDYAATDFPTTLNELPSFLPLLLVAYPHRLTPAFSWRMDRMLSGILEP